MLNALELVSEQKRDKQGSIDVKKGAGLDFYLKHKKFKPNFSRLASYLRTQRDRPVSVHRRGNRDAQRDRSRGPQGRRSPPGVHQGSQKSHRLGQCHHRRRTVNDDKETNALVPLAASLGEMEDSMQQGRNAFAKEHSWVPNLRFEVYSKRLRSAIDHLNDAEIKVKAYRTQLLQLPHDDAQRAALAEAAQSSI
ncbi:MAG TPA: hypothetical protein VKD23_07635 [Terriglobales bacterium]|nr:hypothetical protein [Opitutaceae bacterium]HKB98640.1 hypothetical protein [Terriglobales bacterium]